MGPVAAFKLISISSHASDSHHVLLDNCHGSVNNNDSHGLTIMNHHGLTINHHNGLSIVIPEPEQPSAEDPVSTQEGALTARPCPSFPRLKRS